MIYYFEFPSVICIWNHLRILFVSFVFLLFHLTGNCFELKFFRFPCFHFATALFALAIYYWWSKIGFLFFTLWHYFATRRHFALSSIFHLSLWHDLTCGLGMLGRFSDLWAKPSLSSTIFYAYAMNLFSPIDFPPAISWNYSNVFHSNLFLHFCILAVYCYFRFLFCDDSVLGLPVLPF